MNETYCSKRGSVSGEFYGDGNCIIGNWLRASYDDEEIGKEQSDGIIISYTNIVSSMSNPK